MLLIGPKRDSAASTAWDRCFFDGKLLLTISRNRLTKGNSIMPNRLPLRVFASLAAALPAIALPATLSAQDDVYLPPLAPLPEAEVRSLPPEYRTAPLPAQESAQAPAQSYSLGEVTSIGADGVETVTRTRRIDARAPAQAVVPAGYPQTYAPTAYAPPSYVPAPYAPAQPYAPVAYAPGPVVFERAQWIEECRRRTAGRNNNDTGLIIGGLLGAIAGGVAGYEIAGAGDRVLGTALGVGGGGLIGGLLGSLFGGRKKNRYDCEAALDGYMTQFGTPVPRIASREIPAYSYGYGQQAGYGSYYYAPPQQVVLVPVRTEVQQQVVVRESERFETIPGRTRVIPGPAPLPSPKMIKGGR